jgi:hypothetical protein
MKKDLILSFAEGDVMTNSELNIIYDQLNTLNDALKGTGMLFTQTKQLVVGELSRVNDIMTTRGIDL